MAVVTSVHCCWVILIRLPETPPGLMFSVALLGTVETSAPLTPYSGKRSFLRAKTGVFMFWLEFCYILGGSIRICGIGYSASGFQKSFLDFLIFLPHSDLGAQVGDLGSLLETHCYLSYLPFRLSLSLNLRIFIQYERQDSNCCHTNALLQPGPPRPGLFFVWLVGS